MSHDDDTLAHIDLSAWDAPPPPANLADAVIERMGSAGAGISTPVEGPRELRRTWLVGAAAVAVAMLAIAAWSLLRSPASQAPASGAVVAERARSLMLDGVQADLDPGADVRWRRDGDVLRVEQRAGTVAWRVADKRELVIDAGAALASVEATGANLRVEVQMNAMDARVIGASALTAAAVAMVTVVVYEGHVGVSRPGQQTVVVAPGSTYQVKPAEEPPLVGATAAMPAHGGRLGILGLEQLDSPHHPDEAPAVTTMVGVTLRAAVKADGSYQLAPGADKELLDLKLLMNCANEAPDCMAAIGADLGVDALVFGHVEPVQDGYQVTLKLLDVAHKTVAKSGSWLLPTAEAEGAAFEDWSRKTYAELVGGATTTCDALALKQEGMQAVAKGQHAAALALFERSFACKFDSSVLQLAFMESCSSQNSAKAKLYYKQLSQLQKERLAQICIRNNVEYEDESDDASCDEVSCVLSNYEGACCAKYKKEAAAQNGFVRLATTPPARVWIDGKDTGRRTPVRLALAPGKHKVTFDIDGDRFSYRVMVEPGKTVSMKKAFSDREPASPAKSCDAAGPMEKGMQYINVGQHAAALAQFEKSLACKRDSYVIQLAFMESCSSQNSVKAKLYYKQLTPSQQQKLGQICDRQGVAYK